MTSTINLKKKEHNKVLSFLSPSSDPSQDVLALMAAIVRMSALPQFLIDRNHKVVVWNRALEDSTGISGDDMCGTTQHWKAFYETKRPCLADLLIDRATDEDLALWYCDKWAESERDEKAYEALDFFPNLGKKGRWLHFTAIPIRDNNGTIIGVIESLEDLTELKLMERALQLAHKKLRLMNSIAWHEIENKLTGIRGYVEFSKYLVKNEDYTKYLESEENLLGKIHELLRYTMDYQKIGTQPPCWVNVEKSIHSVISLMEKGSFSSCGDIHSLEIFGDPTLEMMFAYLVKNSLKHGRPVPEIRACIAETREGLQLTYEDNCPGIPHSKKTALFREEIVNADNFYMKFIHDILEYSGMSIQETGDPDKGLFFEILVPKGAYRFNLSSDKAR